MDANKKIVTRADLAELLASIGAPGEKRDEKLQAVMELDMKNPQGHGIHLTLESYQEYWNVTGCSST